MQLQQVVANVVVVAHHFNPTITDQIWLDKNKIIPADEAEGPFLYSDTAVHALTRQFQMMIVPDKCQITLAPTAENAQELLVDRVGRLVSTLPHTPYIAFGMNFIWHYVPPLGEASRISRELFFVPSGRLHRSFDTEDARFGGYLSKNSLGCRLKVDVKPVLAESADNPEVDMILCTFNYHRDLAKEENPVGTILELLGRWNEASQEVKQIAEATFEEIENA